MYTIYLLRSSDGLGYVGQTQNLEQRLGIHRTGKSNTTLIAEAIQDLGWDNFSVEVLEEGLPNKFWANSREEYWILEYNTLYPGGYNGLLGIKHTSDTKKKMSEKRKGIPRSEETKKKLRRFITVPGFTLDDI